MATINHHKSIVWWSVLFNIPMLIVFGLILLYPIIMGVKLSFFNTKLLMPIEASKFLGFRNYLKMFSNIHFWQSLWVTVIYTLGVVVITYLIGLITALVLNPAFRGRSLARILVILPWAVPEVATVLIWRWILDYQYGVINYWGRTLGLLKENLGWLTDPNLALLAVIVVTIWKQFPLATLMLLAGLQTIPLELYEAARIDGANLIQEFKYVTLPGLKPVNVVLTLLLTLYSFKRVTLIFVMTGGGPSCATETLSIQTYLEAFRNFNIGYGSAIGTIMLLIMVVFTILYFSAVSHSNKGEW
jgi:multiple sugar transport system permease protein